jgi:hypothetical protein
MLPFGRTESGFNASAVSTFHENRCDSPLKFPQRNATPLIALSPVRRSKLRMPIFSYFLVVGSVLAGLLLWFGNGSEPIRTALTTSQTIGIPKFKPEPEPEPEHARVTAVNFATEYKRPKPVKTAETPPRQKATTNYSKPQPLSHFAEFPHDNLSIH